MMKFVGERGEALMRIVVAVVTGIILAFWGAFVKILVIINFIWTLISGKRLKDLAELSEVLNTQIYIFLRYITFVSNERPMPFRSLTKSFSKFSR